MSTLEQRAVPNWVPQLWRSIKKINGLGSMVAGDCKKIPRIKSPVGLWVIRMNKTSIWVFLLKVMIYGRTGQQKTCKSLGKSRRCYKVCLHAFSRNYYSAYWMLKTDKTEHSQLQAENRVKTFFWQKSEYFNTLYQFSTIQTEIDLER